MWEAAAGQQVVISGGVSVTGWTLHDAANNIWQAPAPALDTRQIYVNGVRAGIDRMDAASVFGTLTQTSTGYTYTSSGPNS